ncbi:hypothetical protein [Limnovirga soli]|uniref:Uncharacterized protein n=1 Tax=Limnovirga soli TaxID=2656915 RepID=A0A8J8JT98_9BACT|nr:hypothetical protein [Limnovirga soli]NNV54935.1 hypothetical protein [Limnovirga soli]
MGANSDDEHLDNPTINQSENPHDEITSTATAEAINTNQETENMEVHHHAHHEGKKNWKAYFWEFLMLFLAVFCGFLAEYQLEHVIEHNRERQYIESYIEDLKIDTATIRQVKNSRDLSFTKMDSLMQLLKNNQIKGYESDLYYLGRILTRNARFIATDRTITQLKNSGALRLIRNEAAADSILSYDKTIEGFYINQDREREERFNIYPVLSRMFDPFILETMQDKNSPAFIRPINNPPLRSYDKDIQLDLAFNVHQLKSSSLLLDSRLRFINQKATNMIAFLKQEYHIE